MSRCSKSQRQNLIFQYLKDLNESSALTINQIHEKLEIEGIKVSRKAVTRDIDDLSSSHGICSTETRPNKYFAFSDFGIKYDLSLSEPTLQALMIALNNLRQTSHNYFHGMTIEAETAILDSLDEKLSRKLRESKDRYHFECSTAGKPTESDSKDFQTVMQAIRENKVITFKNYSPYQDKEYNERLRRFAPYIFSLSAGTPFLVAKDIEDGNIKMLRVTRMREVELTDLSFTPDDINEINLESVIGGFGGPNENSEEIKVICNSQMGTYFKERTIHKSQTVEKLGEDKYLVSFNCANSREIIRMIASFGGCVKSVEPVQIYSEVKKIWSQGLKNAS